MQFDIINPMCYPNFDNILLSRPEYSFFQSSHWAKVLFESYQYTPLYFTHIQRQKIKYLIPVMVVKSTLTGKRGVSLPFSDYCDPILDNNRNPKDVFDYILNFGKQAGWKSYEIRGENGTRKNSNSSLFYGHTLNLQKSEEELFSNFRASTRRNIKKASREGVEIHICNSHDSLLEFYRLHRLTRKRHGLPPQPPVFFNKIHKHIISKNYGIVVLSSFEGKYIAGAIFFHLGHKAIYKFGASDRNYLKLRPNNLIMWETIKWCLRNGFSTLCFGRTDPQNIGLRRFKIGWGATEKVIKYSKYDFSKESFIKNSSSCKNLYKTAIKLIPQNVSALLGKTLYKHVG